MERSGNFTSGKIFFPLIRFMLPVLLALLLQNMYGAVDLLIVGKFAASADVSGVSTGSQIMFTFTMVVSSFSMGATILLGHQIGRKKEKEAGRTIGAGIVLFFIIAVIMTAALFIFAEPVASLMRAPKEAFTQTIGYMRICSLGSVVIVAYNLIGSIFRGIGDSKTPLVTVAIACACNIAGDLLLVAGFGMAANGAAIATVAAQGISVLASLLIIRKKALPFELKKEQIRFDRKIIGKITSLGAPIALQDFLVSASFLIILAIVNSLGLTASAGVGVAHKIIGFIMVVPSAFMQAMSAFVAQNAGARRYDRAGRALFYSIAVSLAAGLVMFYFGFFHGKVLTGLFSNDPVVVAAAADYLKAYAIDTILTSFLFCFVGNYNGLGLTKFIMLQGIAGAFAARVPLSLVFSRIQPPSLFRIGLAAPFSTVLQILLCFLCMIYVRKRFFNRSSS